MTWYAWFMLGVAVGVLWLTVVLLLCSAAAHERDTPWERQPW